MTSVSLRRARGSITASLSEPFEASTFQPASKLTTVMYVISDLSVGGAEMSLYKLLTQTDRQRFAPVVVSLIDQGSLRERIEALGIAVHCTGMKPGRPTAAGLWRLIRLIRSIKPDLLIGWMYHSCLAAEVAKLLSGQRIPVLWSIHYSLSSLATEKKLTAAVIKLCGLISKLPAKIVHVSRAGQSQHESFGYQSKNSCVIPNGIDLEEFRPSAAARLSVREELKLPVNAFLIGLTGRYHLMKDHANFLRAAALILKTHPETHFLLIGRGVDKENPELRKSIEQLTLDGSVHLLGERRDTPRLAAALDLFSVSSSYGESCPVVVGEAMACGVPCVVTDVGDAGWIVGDTGLVVPPRDPHALATAWKALIDIGSRQRQAMGVLARARVNEHFPIQSIMTRYEDLFATVLAGEAPQELVSLTSPGINTLGATLE
jgi:glycosyltransferase involved in cell wall biosynthesis